MADEFELKVGMSFGTYTDKFNELSKRKDLFSEETGYILSIGKEQYEFYDKETKEVKAQMYRTYNAPSKVAYTQSIFCKEGDIIYEGSRETTKGGCMENFTKISTPTQWAADLNMNGIIDEGEICDK